MHRPAILACLLPLVALLPLIGDSPASTATVFKNAVIHTAAGPRIDNGILVIDKGKIVAVGDAKTPIPKGARVIDAKGKTIIPGLVDTHSHIGIYPRPQVKAHSDGNEGSGPVQSSLRAEDAIWPGDPGIKMARAGGVTTANIMPGSGNVIGGQTLYVKLRGSSIKDMRIGGMDVLGGLKMANGENPKGFNFGRNKMPPATRMKLAALQRAEFVKAREYKKKWDDFKAKKSDKEPETDLSLEPLKEVLERKRTVHFHCHRADDLMTALRLAKEFNFEIVLQHATDGHRVTRELASRKIPVSLTLIDSPGGKLEVAGLLEENAAILEKAGVLVAINTDDFITESRFYLRTGAIAVRGGMSEASALKALTINPAKMMHLDKRLGSLEKGKDADFVVLSGSPFSIYSRVLQTYIDGKIVFDASKASDLAYQIGGYTLKNPPASPSLATKSLPPVKAPAIPKGSPVVTASSKKIAILAGRIHTVSGASITNGVILIEDGKIAAVGPRAKIQIPKGTPILSAAVVTPGLIDAHSTVGLSGATNTPGDQDQDEKTDPNQADLRVLDGFNPDDALMEFIRREGVTTIHAVPGRVNVIAGQTGIFKTVGRTADAMKIRFPAGLLVNLGEVPKAAYPSKVTTRMAVASLVRKALVEARNQAKAKKGASARHDALNLALSRKIPVLFAAHRSDDIATALRLAKEFNLAARIELATEGFRIADTLAKAGVPVVLHPPMQRIGTSMETINSYLPSAAVLAGKKVPLAISTGFEGYVPKTRVLRYEAAVAAVNGLGQEKALAAVTLEAAKILGIDKTRGSIEKGKVADLVLYDGDCFENATHVTYTLIDGKVVWDRGEHLKLPFSRRAIPLSGGGGYGCCLGW